MRTVTHPNKNAHKTYTKVAAALLYFILNQIISRFPPVANLSRAIQGRGEKQTQCILFPARRAVKHTCNYFKSSTIRKNPLDVYSQPQNRAVNSRVTDEHLQHREERLGQTLMQILPAVIIVSITCSSISRSTINQVIKKHYGRPRVVTGGATRRLNRSGGGALSRG